jgi:hypothetical protein
LLWSRLIFKINLLKKKNTRWLNLSIDWEYDPLGVASLSGGLGPSSPHLTVYFQFPICWCFICMHKPSPNYPRHPHYVTPREKVTQLSDPDSLVPFYFVPRVGRKEGGVIITQDAVRKSSRVNYLIHSVLVGNRSIQSLIRCSHKYVTLNGKKVLKYERIIKIRDSLC